MLSAPVKHADSLTPGQLTLNLRGKKTFGRSGANRLGFPRLDTQHLDLEIQSFPCERMIEIQNHGFRFDFTNMDNLILPL
jgi:hypothetical protein